MNEPTKEQQQWLWEKCGFKHTNSPNEFIRRNWWTNPEHHCESHLPDLDLNNLFKYAVPIWIEKIMAEQECSSDVAYEILFKKWLQELQLNIPHVALALV